SFAEVPAHSLALARRGGYKSHTATNSTFGTSRINFASNMPRPPQPTSPICTRSFAPITRSADRALVAESAAAVGGTLLMECRRFMGMDLFYSWVCPRYATPNAPNSASHGLRYVRT